MISKSNFNTARNGEEQEYYYTSNERKNKVRARKKIEHLNYFSALKDISVPHIPSVLQTLGIIKILRVEENKE